jgi:hypothetical protein
MLRERNLNVNRSLANVVRADGKASMNSNKLFVISIMCNAKKAMTKNYDNE